MIQEQPFRNRVAQLQEPSAKLGDL